VTPPFDELNDMYQRALSSNQPGVAATTNFFDTIGGQHRATDLARARFNAPLSQVSPQQQQQYLRILHQNIGNHDIGLINDLMGDAVRAGDVNAAGGLHLRHMLPAEQQFAAQFPVPEGRTRLYRGEASIGGPPRVGFQADKRGQWWSTEHLGGDVYSRAQTRHDMHPWRQPGGSLYIADVPSDKAQRLMAFGPDHERIAPPEYRARAMSTVDTANQFARRSPNLLSRIARKSSPFALAAAGIGGIASLMGRNPYDDPNDQSLPAALARAGGFAST
jgi:hypothetical protein